jgi:hypothetical protein
MAVSDFVSESSERAMAPVLESKIKAPRIETVPTPILQESTRLLLFMISPSLLI